MPKDNSPLTISKLSTSEAVTALGLTAVKHLSENKEVSMYVALDGTIQVAFPGEFTLDGIPETQAINALLESGKSEKDVEMYLRGRDARMNNRNV